MDTAQLITLALALIAVFLLYAIDPKESFLSYSFLKSGAKWSKGTAPGGVVSFYKDTFFSGPRKDYPVGTAQASLSKGVFGLGLDKENDTYSSLQVPQGLNVQVWEHNDYVGNNRVFTAGDYPDLRQFGFHDNISSLKVW
jgi:hypothetical protein